MEYVLAVASSPNFAIYKFGRAVRTGFCHIADHFIPHTRNNYYPYILSRRALTLFSALLVVLKIFVLSVLAFGSVAPAYSSAITGDNIINLTNLSRREYNFKPLVSNGLLAQAAQAKADDMLAKGYFAHNTPEGKTPWSFINAVEYNYLMAGENLAVNFTESEAVEDAWMNSPGHKANILNKNFEEIGIGISQGVYQGHSAIFVVQMFGTPAEQNVRLSNVSTKIQTTDIPQPAQAAGAAIPISAAKLDSAKSGKTVAAKTSGSVKVPVKSLRSSAVEAKQSAQAVKPTAPAPELLEEPIIPEAVKIVNTSVQVSNNLSAIVLVETNASASKVVVFYGNRAVMLEPKNNTHWEGAVSLEKVAAASGTLRVVAFDLRDRRDEAVVGEFAASTPGNFNVLGAASPVKVAAFGKNFDVKAMEQKFYLLFIAGLLTSLVLAIGIKRHIQHLPLITNSSFVAILAALLFWAG